MVQICVVISKLIDVPVVKCGTGQCSNFKTSGRRFVEIAD
jgi:hypothetical protein